MMEPTIYRWILPALIAVFVLHRGYYTRRHAADEARAMQPRKEGGASRFAGLLGLLATSAYIVNPAWIAWAALPLAAWMRWTGVIAAGLGFALLQWAQNTLGRNWSDNPRLLAGQTLVMAGPYRWVRHPIYAAFVLILGSTGLIAANGLIGLCWLGMTAIEAASRIEFEERLMLASFGQQYRDYSRRTGALLPRIT